MSMRSAPATAPRCGTTRLAALLTLSVQRGVVHCHVGNPKTLARRKPIPLAPELLTVLHEHRERAAYPADSDWVFASPYKHGAEPYWPDSALQDFVKPAATRAGITKRVGWHTFRYSYSTLFRANGTDVKVQVNCSGIPTSAPLSTCTPKRLATRKGPRTGRLLLAV